jgi:sugar/nucleoside kinase (ribokinase family)
MNEQHEQLDFVSIGDIVTDAFIRIKQASVYYDDNEREEKVCLTNGSKIPYEFAKVVPGVGNSPNAAVSATRLGLKAALVTNLGDDDNGNEIINALKRNNIDQRFVTVHPGKVSNYHYVLWHKAERTILIKHEDYQYVLPELGQPRWIYFSSVGENSMDYHHTIADYVRNNPETKLAFQPGTFQIKLGYETLKDIYELAEVFFCNKEEAQLILKTQEDSIARLAKEMSERGPNIAVITDGHNGACAYDGTDAWFIPIYPDPAPPLERTGAGDSFSSTFTSALALGKSPDEALMWGPINSMNVVQHIGAQEGLLTRDKLEQKLSQRPENYTPTKVAL